MKIIKEGSAPFVSRSSSGAVLTIGGIAIDLDAAQGDVETRIIVWRDKGGGYSLDGGERYAALIVIPPQAWVETSEGEETILAPAPVDLARVTLHLWPLEG